MSRRIRGVWSIAASVSIILSGCHPTQPFFFLEDGDLSHYIDVATQLEEADVDQPPLDEVQFAQSPLTLKNDTGYEFHDLTLLEATRTTLQNSQVMRQLGGRITASRVSAAPESISRSLITTGGVTTTYDPALVETGIGVNTGVPFSGTGVESALAEFDATLRSRFTWEKNFRPQNAAVGGVVGAFFAPVFNQHTGNFNVGVSKVAATGGRFSIDHNIIYDANNNPTRFVPTDSTVNVEAAFVQPLLQGAGLQYNRIAGPQSIDTFNSGFFNQLDGVVIARIRHDISLTEFEGGVRDLINNLEEAYWELYFTYRDLEAKKTGRNSALETWRKVHALYKRGAVGGEAEKEAQSRSQYFFFRSQVETAFTDLLRAENRLRFIMGLRPSDGRLMRPIDEPTTARVQFDWSVIHCEALARRVEIRKLKWQIPFHSKDRKNP